MTHQHIEARNHFL